MLKHSLRYLIVSIFLAVFGGVYEIFSHEVYSYYMIYAFAIPLILGALPSLIIALKGKKQPSRLTAHLWAFGISALTVGSVFNGVLAIYGTTNNLIYVYPVAGGIFILSGLISFLVVKEKKRNEQRVFVENI